MSLFDLFIIAVGLSMDAFAVSVCKGLAVPKIQPKHVLTVGGYFGGFQALMPFLGYLLGNRFSGLITEYDHWVAFVLLIFIGGGMIRDSRSKSEKISAEFGIKTMLPLAVATSIDALAIGITFAFLQVEIVPAVCFIGLITFMFACAGIRVGNAFGLKYKSKAEIAGGAILIFMGIRILISHLT